MCVGEQQPYNRVVGLPSRIRLILRWQSHGHDHMIVTCMHDATLNNFQHIQSFKVPLLHNSIYHLLSKD